MNNEQGISIFSEMILREFEEFLFEHLGEFGKETIEDMRQTLFFGKLTTLRDLSSYHIGKGVVISAQMVRRNEENFSREREP